MPEMQFITPPAHLVKSASPVCIITWPNEAKALLKHFNTHAVRQESDAANKGSHSEESRCESRTKLRQVVREAGRSAELTDERKPASRKHVSVG